MKKASVLIMCFCLSAFIASCSQSEHKVVAKNNDDNEKAISSTTENDVDESGRATKKALEKKPIGPITQGKKSISINGEKYIYTDDKLQKGSEVRSLNMSESGTVKGSFVVVLRAGEVLNVSFKHVNKIAKDTYRITPSQTDDLMTVYKQLLSNESFNRVELEVVYGSRKNIESKDVN